jgi:predicted ATP-dependent protease
MNQKGIVQPIGGVNEKVIGFFEVCQARGLTGQQGVIIPARNLNNLMLPAKVLKAIKAGEFFIYKIENIDQALEIMLAKPAAEIHAAVQAKLAEYAELESEEYEAEEELVDSEAGDPVEE